jgi:transcriptional regulator with XRE-family HTH domain
VPTSPSSAATEARQAFGQRLKRLRVEAQLTGRALAEACGWHFTKVSKIEHGRQEPSTADLRAWCQACGAVGELADLLATLRTVRSAYVEYRQVARAGLRQVLGPHTLARYEATSLFRILEHNVIPGLLQTEDYTRAMLAFWFGFLQVPNDMDQAVAVRVARQAVLRRPGKRFEIVLEEQALRTWFGTAATMAGQLRHLLACMRLPSVSVGVIPLMRCRSGAPSSGFWVFDDELAALEVPTAGIEVTRPAEIGLYIRLFDQMRGQALHGAAARAVIQRALEETEAVSEQP